jgi:3'-phosphoadenosine 5'-phosphosulfate (PAPS) 3'-phosphatase
MVATGDDLMDKVASVLQDVSHDVIQPRFEKLHQDDIRFKSPGEVVTVADELAERQLKARLGELVPDACSSARRHSPMAPACRQPCATNASGSWTPWTAPPTSCLVLRTGR